MKIEYLKSFRRDLLKLNRKQQLQLGERIELFKKDPYHPQLRLHPLRGKLKGYHSINISGDLRAICILHHDHEEDLFVEFVTVGTHSQLY